MVGAASAVLRAAAREGVLVVAHAAAVRVRAVVAVAGGGAEAVGCIAAAEEEVGSYFAHSWVCVLRIGVGVVALDGGQEVVQTSGWIKCSKCKVRYSGQGGGWMKMHKMNVRQHGMTD